jgi:hypothetical protein
MGDLTFVGPEGAEPKQSLTPAEIYMLAGTGKGQKGDGSYGPWNTMVFNAAYSIYMETGSLPDRLTDAVLRKSNHYKDVSNASIELFRNPLTGEWPSLKAQQFSPGDLYIRPLSNTELRHFASLSPIYSGMWLEGKGPGGRGNRQLSGPVFYVRIYGAQGVISNGFSFFMTGN